MAQECKKNKGAIPEDQDLEARLSVHLVLGVTWHCFRGVAPRQRQGGRMVEVGIVKICPAAKTPLMRELGTSG